MKKRYYLPGQTVPSEMERETVRVPKSTLGFSAFCLLTAILAVELGLVPQQKRYQRIANVALSYSEVSQSRIDSLVREGKLEQGIAEARTAYDSVSEVSVDLPGHYSDELRAARMGLYGTIMSIQEQKAIESGLASPNKSSF